MAIGTAYFDASGKKELPVLVVAGFLSPTLVWLRFEKEWKRSLAWYGISALHMKDFAHSTGEFAPWKGEEKLRARFLGDLLRIIKEHVDNSFATAVYMRDYAEIDQEYCLREWAHPYAIAGTHCIAKIHAWAAEFGLDFSKIDHVFETGDEGKGDLFKLAYEHVSVDPIFKPKEWSVAFQAADLIAYEHFKANLKVLDMGEGMAGIDDLRIPFQSLITIPGSMQWGVVLKDDLIRNCVKYGIPKREHK
jgi:hypothetical protein